MQKVLSSKRKSASSTTPKKVAIFAGGTSPERSISLVSGRAIEKALQQAGFETLFFDTGECRAAQIFRQDFDVVFIALHGAGGEDGKWQKVLERRHIPYVGSDPEGCRLSFDKHLTKKILLKKGLPTPAFFVIREKDWKAKIAKQAGAGAYFMKPFADGSSLGIMRVANLKGASALLQKHIKRYKKLIFEEEIVGSELTVGILKDKALPVIELKPERKFYDYKAKYTKGLCRYVVPAQLSDSKTRQVQRLALKVHRALKLKDFSRVDIMLDGKGNPFVLEANSIPGFTSFSLLPKAAAYAGVPFDQLCSGLVKRAYKRAKQII